MQSYPAILPRLSSTPIHLPSTLILEPGGDPSSPHPSTTSILCSSSPVPSGQHSLTRPISSTTSEGELFPHL